MLNMSKKLDEAHLTPQDFALIAKHLPKDCSKE